MQTYTERSGTTGGSVVVTALCYKPEGRGLETRGGDFLF
jgi:hypothetical protein